MPARPRDLSPGAADAARAGFTLLEVLLAMAIFSICMSAIYTSFRTASSAFERGRRSSEVTQTARFTIDQITRDLRSAYYETDYDQRFLNLERQMQSQADMDLDALDIVVDGLLGPRGSDDDEEADDGEGPPRYIGLKYDLHFSSIDGDEADQLQFAHFLPSDGTFDNSFLGAERVHYYVAQGNLYRRRSRVASRVRVNPDLEDDLRAANEERERQRDETGALPMLLGGLMGRHMPGSVDMLPGVEFFVEEPADPLPPELLAQNVVTFDVHFGHYFGTWQEADSWDSEAKRHRTAEFHVPQGDPNFLDRLVAFQERPSDHLPSYVRIFLGIDNRSGRQRRKHPGPEHARVTTTEAVVWLPAAIEVYVPADDSQFEPTRSLDEETLY